MNKTGTYIWHWALTQSSCRERMGVVSLYSPRPCRDGESGTRCTYSGVAGYNVVPQCCGVSVVYLDKAVRSFFTAARHELVHRSRRSVRRCALYIDHRCALSLSSLSDNEKTSVTTCGLTQLPLFRCAAPLPTWVPMDVASFLPPDAVSSRLFTVQRGEELTP